MFTATNLWTILPTVWQSVNSDCCNISSWPQKLLSSRLWSSLRLGRQCSAVVTIAARAILFVSIKWRPTFISLRRIGTRLTNRSQKHIYATHGSLLHLQLRAAPHWCVAFSLDLCQCFVVRGRSRHTTNIAVGQSGGLATYFAIIVTRRIKARNLARSFLSV